MRNLPIPQVQVQTIFDDCIVGVSNGNKHADLLLAADKFIDAERNYMAAAEGRTLFLLPSSDEGNNDFLFGGLTKQDLKNLYTEQMVPAKKAARHHYDSLILSAPLRRCPYCGFGRATTLDHFLSKSHFPWLSIVPANLVPACKDCNHGKAAKVPKTAADQTVHPYFESALLSNNQWLFATLIRTAQPYLEYRVDSPPAWCDDLRKRVERHFVDYNLNERFAVEAATELASLRLELGGLCRVAGTDAVVQHLVAKASAEAALQLNSWQTALYQALSGCDWYIEGGYLME